MQKITSVDKDNLEAIAIGGAVLGSGGGGDPYVGRLMTNQILEKAEPVKVIEVETLNDDELILPIAMMGAPTVMMEKFPSGNEFTRAISVNNVLIPTGEIDLAGGRFGIGFENIKRNQEAASH